MMSKWMKSEWDEDVIFFLRRKICNLKSTFETKSQSCVSAPVAFPLLERVICVTVFKKMNRYLNDVSIQKTCTDINSQITRKMNVSVNNFSDFVPTVFTNT